MSTFNSMNERGTAMVELALVLPLLVMLVFGVVEFGRALYQEQVVTKSAVAAVRFLSRSYSVLDEDCTTLAGWDDQVTKAQQLALYGGEDTPLIPNMNMDDVQVSVFQKTMPSPGGVVCIVKVAIAVQFDGLFGDTMVPFTKLPSMVLNSAVDAVYIGE